MRLFIAFDPPDQAMDVIRPACSLLRKQLSGIKWESEERFHSTIKFLGECKEEQIPGIISLLSDLCGEIREDIPVRFRNFHLFSGRARSGVVVATIEDPTGRLSSLHQRLETELEEIGFSRETRPFKPHLTIGRTRQRNRPEILREKTETVTFKSDLVLIGEIALVASTLTSGGSIYRTIFRFRFGTEPPSRHSNRT